MNGNDSAGLTQKEWLKRIEDGLIRIEDKLDKKAEKAEVDALESRLHLIESLGTEQSRRAETDVRALSERLEDRCNSMNKSLTDLKIKVYGILGGVAILAAVLEVLRQGGILS